MTSNIKNSTGFLQDNVAPEAGGLYPCKTEYEYPTTKFHDFDWWWPQEKKSVCAITRDEIPIPQFPNRYPYRYSSAAPSISNKTQKEWDIERCMMRIAPKKRMPDRVDPLLILQAVGYETESMTASLQPYVTVPEREFRSSEIPRMLNTPSWLSYGAHSAFDQYVIDVLHPGWKNDPLYRKRLLFRFKYFEPDETDKE